jgi:uncharacterized protein
MVDVSLLILSGLLALIGIVGSMLPVIPGPLCSYSALILLSWAKDFTPLGARALILLGLLTVVVSVADNFIPAMSAKKYGASKFGIWGSLIGMVLLMIVFPPWGIFLGSFLGAVFGEVLHGAKGKNVLRVGWGVFLGTMLGTGIKLGFSITVLGFYMMHLF